MGYKTQIIDDKQIKRDQLAKQMDNFSTFRWRGESSFEKFGMFIIAEKRGDLKFYNGPSFSNEYGKTQFSNSSGELLGITFNRQQVSFKVGMYYFTIEDWRDFLEWVNAYEVNYLTFDYAPKYGYLVKLAKMEDSPRYVVGYSGGEPVYYTEMTLTWDLQGDSCVRSNLPYEWKYENEEFTLNEDNKDVGSTTSRLETPLLLTIPLSINKEYIEIEFKHKTNTLFKVTLQNMSTNNQIVEEATELTMNTNDFYKQNIFLIQPTIQYDSETGVLLYSAGDTSWKLLHLNMTDDEGNYMIKNMQVNKFKLQGDVAKYEFTLSIIGASIPDNTQPMLQVYERTNVI